MTCLGLAFCIGNISSIVFWLLSVCVEKPKGILIPDLFGWGHCVFCFSLLILLLVSDKFHRDVFCYGIIFIHGTGHNQESCVVLHCSIFLLAPNLEQFLSLSFSIYDTEGPGGSLAHVLENVSKVYKVCL